MIFIRADANSKIGTGHVMRCLSIAQVFAQRGEKVVFITADHKGDELITRQGYTTVCLDTEWTDMESELPYLINLIEKHKPSLFLIDSYYVTNNYFEILFGYVSTVYIDDLNVSCWNVDYLVNYNIFAETFDYSAYCNTRTKLLLGPQYAPLREEFKKIPPHEIKSDVTDILVSAGGADPEGITERVMTEICQKHSQMMFHFVVGALNPRIERIQCSKPSNVILHINEKYMSKLMEKCDVAISAAGTTLYELCATGIPTITYTLADNQLAAAEQFYEKGIMLNAGDCRTDARFILRLESLFCRIIEDVSYRQILSTKMQSFVDGNGAERIIRTILFPSYTISVNKVGINCL